MDREKTRGGQEPERKEMTRGQQTGWIVGALAVLGFLAFNYMESHDASDPNAACKSIFETSKDSCRARLAMQRMGM